MKKIMILGGSLAQLPYIKQKIKTIVLDKNDKAIGKEYADKFYNVDISKEDEVLEIAKENKIDGIISPGTDFSTTSSFVAAWLKLPSPSYISCNLVSNKFRFRTFLKKNNFPVPNFYKTNKNVSHEKPYIIKPLKSMGARGVYKVIGENKKIRENEPLLEDDYLVEDFLNGPEISVDSFFNNGKLFIIGFSDREFFMEPYFIEKSHIMPTCFPFFIRKKIYNYLVRLGNLLNVKNGSMKADLKIVNGEIYFIELALRSSGKSFHKMANKIYKNNPIKNVLNTYLGKEVKEKIDPVFIDRKNILKEYSIFSIPGVFDEIISIDNKFYKTITNYKKGDEINNLKDNSKIIGTFITNKELQKNPLIVKLQKNQKTEEFINKKILFYESNKKERDWNDIHYSEALAFCMKQGKKIDKNFWDYFNYGGIQGGLLALGV